ncbi:MAG: hypothetical protein V1674_00655 [Candidatus Omnitrophota bacterium]
MSDKGTINKQINMRETYDSGGEHLQGEAQIDYAGDKGSWTMNTTAQDYHYRDVTIFDDGMKVDSESIGLEEISRNVTH